MAMLLCKNFFFFLFVFLLGLLNFAPLNHRINKTKIYARQTARIDRQAL